MDGRSIFTILKLLLLLLWSCWPLYGGVVLFGGGCYWRFLLLVVRLDLTVTEFLLSFKKVGVFVSQAIKERQQNQSKMLFVGVVVRRQLSLDCLFVRPSARPSIYPSIHPSVHATEYLSVLPLLSFGILDHK